jgi:hypothetical protein
MSVQLHAPATLTSRKESEYLLYIKLQASQGLSGGYSEDTTNKTNSVALVRKRTIPTERPPFVGEVSVNFNG